MAISTALVLCLMVGDAAPVRVPVDHFTLSWTHSIEKVEWVEDWRLGPAGLWVEQAHVKGSGVGMEPGPDARLIDGWWVYRPALPPQKAIMLSASAFTPDHRLCAGSRCAPLADWAKSPGDLPVQMVACPASD